MTPFNDRSFAFLHLAIICAVSRIVAPRADLSITKTNRSRKGIWFQNHMEVRLVTAASRGFFFSLSRGSRSRLRRSQSQLRYEKKNPLAPRVVLAVSYSNLPWIVAYRAFSVRFSGTAPQSNLNLAIDFIR